MFCGGSQLISLDAYTHFREIIHGGDSAVGATNHSGTAQGLHMAVTVTEDL